MAVFDPTPPKFDLTYNAGKTDIGAGYASGITEAGKAIGGAISGVSSLMQQRQDATDTLNAMHGSGMLSDDQYKAIAGKSLGAQQSMIGMYSTAWIAQQAQAREMAKMGYGANLDIWKQHQALLDQFALNKATKPQQYPIQQGQQQPVQQQPPAPQAQPVQPIVPQRRQPIGQQNLTVSGIPGVAAPLGSGNITNPVAAQPQYRIGAPLAGQPPAGARMASDAQGKPGYVVPDAAAPGGYTFHPRA
jgi:hypothetical protein